MHKALRSVPSIASINPTQCLDGSDREFETIPSCELGTSLGSTEQRLWRLDHPSPLKLQFWGSKSVGVQRDGEHGGQPHFATANSGQS